MCLKSQLNNFNDNYLFGRVLKFNQIKIEAHKLSVLQISICYGVCLRLIKGMHNKHIYSYFLICRRYNNKFECFTACDFANCWLLGLLILMII